VRARGTVRNEEHQDDVDADGHDQVSACGPGPKG
jgi:hypothetical protein